MTATVSAGPLITEPGVYDLSDDAYHADPVAGGSLSSTDARGLLPPSCPARWRWEREHGREPRRAWDLGHAAHRLVLGAGPEIVVVDAADWRTKAAKEQRDEARERGAVPLLAAEWEQVEAMADALREHPVAGALFDRGRPEATLIWRDDRAGVMCRARPDWLPEPGPGRLIVPDYKTCHSAWPEALARAVHQHGYHQQAAWYLAGLRALGLADQDAAAFVFVCQEKAPPWLVTVVELDHTALRIGATRNRRALSIYEHCVAADHWPAYSDDAVELVSLPTWAEIQEGEHLA